PANARQKVLMLVNGQAGNTFSYSIGRRSSTILEIGGAPGTIQSGWIKITPLDKNAAPVSQAVFRSGSSASVSESVVPGQTASSNFSMYVEHFGGADSSVEVESVATLVNPSGNRVTATLELVTLGGMSTGLTSAVVIPARGKISRALNGFPGFENVPNDFQGV